MLHDERMPKIALRAQEHIIDVMWNDIREELLLEVAVVMDEQTPDSKESMDRAPVTWLRAKARYHLDPYDRSIWSKIWDPWFLLFKLLGLCPVMGVGPGVYLLLFLVIDKEDEYQLTNFILQFKGMHFT